MVVVSHSVMRDKLMDGLKTQTVRPVKSDHWLNLEPGIRLQHYWKLRKPKVEKDLHFIGESEVENVQVFMFTKFRDGSKGGYWSPYEKDDGTYVEGRIYCPECGAKSVATVPVYDFDCPGCGYSTELVGDTVSEAGRIPRDELNEIAARDGFESFDDMWEWFDDRYNISIAVLYFAVIRYDWVEE